MVDASFPPGCLSLRHPRSHETQQSLRDYLFQENYFPSLAFKTLKRGKASGILGGGCLSLVVGTLGTPFEIDTTNKILFLEDVNEAPYRIDRMLTHLRNAKKFDRISAIVFGEMVGCLGKNEELWEILDDFFAKDSFPIVYNVPSGHGDVSMTIPFDRKVILDTESNYLAPIGNLDA